MRHNEHGQPIGQELPGWSSRPFPAPVVLTGRNVVLEPLDVDRHAEALSDAFRDAPGSMWTYLPYGPFDREAMRDRLTRWAGSRDPTFFVIESPASQPLGWAALQRIDPRNGTIEVAHVCYSPALQRTIGATEAMWLMMRYAFEDLGYRRYEWKCDALNQASRAAAERLGFTFEGVFRNHMVYRGRNRDTAWYSITDDEWPAIDTALRAWLEPDNHEAGRQRKPLRTFRTIPG
jgi:RimJ/RimL family protein N-acetyltransferase